MTVPDRRGIPGADLQRPLAMRLLPPRLRLSLWARYYRGRASGRTDLYRDASLDFAPGIRMRLVPGDVISDSIALTGIYELALTRRVRELAAAGGTLVEVGANLGYFSLLWASVSAASRVTAIEASPRNIRILEENVCRNGLADRVRVLGVAAGAAAGRMTFDPGPPDQTGWGGLSAETTRDAIQVDVVRLDEVVGASEPIALLKIDAEGADTWVIEGCERLLRARAVRELWFEQNKPRMHALGIPLDRAADRLRDLGYHAMPDADAAGDVVEWRAVPAA